VVVHTCNPSYSGGRGRKIGSRPSAAKNTRPYLKKKKKENNKLKAKRLGGVAQVQIPEFNPQDCKLTTKSNQNEINHKIQPPPSCISGVQLARVVTGRV
jgi:hypothetical protein